MSLDTNSHNTNAMDVKPRKRKRPAYTEVFSDSEPIQIGMESNDQETPGIFDDDSYPPSTQLPNDPNITYEVPETDFESESEEDRVILVKRPKVEPDESVVDMTKTPDQIVPMTDIPCVRKLAMTPIPPTEPMLPLLDIGKDLRETRGHPSRLQSIFQDLLAHEDDAMPETSYKMWREHMRQYDIDGDEGSEFYAIHALLMAASTNKKRAIAGSDMFTAILAHEEPCNILLALALFENTRHGDEFFFEGCDSQDKLRLMSPYIVTILLEENPTTPYGIDLLAPETRGTRFVFMDGLETPFVQNLVLVARIEARRARCEDWKDILLELERKAGMDGDDYMVLMMWNLCRLLFLIYPNSELNFKETNDRIEAIHQRECRAMRKDSVMSMVAKTDEKGQARLAHMIPRIIAILMTQRSPKPQTRLFEDMPMNVGDVLDLFNVTHSEMEETLRVVAKFGPTRRSQ